MKNIFKKYKNPKTNKIINDYEFVKLSMKERIEFGELDEDGFFLFSMYEMTENINTIQNDEIVSGFFTNLISIQ